MRFRRRVIVGSEPAGRLGVALRVGSGRGCGGQIVTRHRCSRGRTLLRRVNWCGVIRRPGRIVAMARDIFRSAAVGLVRYGAIQAYCLLPAALEVGAAVNREEPFRCGPLLPQPLYRFRFGAVVHGLRRSPLSAPLIARAAGSAARIGQRLARGIAVTLPSGQKYFLPPSWAASAGAMGSALHYKAVWGNAGSLRRRGRRPAVRGTAMNPVDHPHGGKSGPGRSSVSP